jgi:hypothetical protein
VVGGLALIAPEACTQILGQKSPRAIIRWRSWGSSASTMCAVPASHCVRDPPANLDPDIGTRTGLS